jgi:hypothetical protein
VPTRAPFSSKRHRIYAVSLASILQKEFKYGKVSVFATQQMRRTHPFHCYNNALTVTLISSRVAFAKANLKEN